MPAKITRPLVSGAVARERLFTLLDKSSEKPVTWLCAPGGSGKSTLVASYLDARELPSIWYHCDEGDADPATFFYYIGLAAKNSAPRRKPLPLLTPEYLPGLATFTRRYFEDLFARCKTIVIDNYETVPVSPLHELLAAGLEAATVGVRILVISRTPPPTPFAGLQAKGRIELLTYNDLRLTIAESKALIKGRTKGLPVKFIRTLYTSAQGWAAGLILMLERGEVGKTSAEPVYDRVFEYFAGELFDRAEEDVRGFLMKSAFLPTIKPLMADKLIGSSNAANILLTLHQRQLFTEKLFGSSEEYQYHPLFRQFLLSRAKSGLATDELSAIRRRAATLLEESGLVEDAARLYSEAVDTVSLSRLVIRHARELLGQGRNRTIEEWAACIPVATPDINPWFWYWVGVSAFPIDMPRSRAFLDKAFAEFKPRHDSTGLYVAWVGIVDSYAFGDGWENLDNSIAVFDELTGNYPDFETTEIELMVSSRILLALTLRKPDQPGLVQRWHDRVSTLLKENPSFDILMDTVFCMSVYCLWKGDYFRNGVLLEQAEAEIRNRTPSPFASIRIKLMKGIHYWVAADYQAAIRILGEALENSAKSGVHVYDSLLWVFRAAAEMAPGNLDLAQESLRNQQLTMVAMKSELHSFFYHINAAWCALLANNPDHGAEHLEMIRETVQSMGTPYYLALWHLGMAQTAALQGERSAALHLVRIASRISLAMQSQVLEWYSLLIEADILLKNGDEEEGLPLLRRALSLGRRHGYVHLEFYLPEMYRRLLAKALDQSLEEEYVTGLIRKLGLTPPDDCHTASSTGCILKWPFPVKIYTLGRFEILVNDQPVEFSGKEQKKPLEMLKALIAYGGSEVSRDRLTDALWPEADGDQALKSFETNLSRLRKLLGGDSTILYRSHKLTLNRQKCRVDALLMTHLLEKGRNLPPDQVLSISKSVLKLYKGEFLPDDVAAPWSMPQRELLKNRMLRVIADISRHLEHRGEFAEAVEYLDRGIGIDLLAEDLYRRLMICHDKLGNHVAVVRIWNRCETLLKTELGIDPSPETFTTYKAIVRWSKV